jgi:Holliday junction DNA helicase RuvA
VIARLTGRVEAIEADRCVVDVGGVGYLVMASTRTLAALPSAPAMATVLIARTRSRFTVSRRRPNASGSGC